MRDEVPLDRQILPFFFDLRIRRLAGALLACERSQPVRRRWFDHADTYSCTFSIYHSSMAKLAFRMFPRSSEAAVQDDAGSP